MTNTELHPIFRNSTLSDHIKQIADFNINNKTIRIVSHNMLNKCHAGKWPDNAWNISETEEQYQARLDIFAREYKEDIQNGTNVIALQEAPREEIAKNFFQTMQLDSSWKYQVRNTGATDEQALMFIYNEDVTGAMLSINEHLAQRANSYLFNIQGINVHFINIHVSYEIVYDDNILSSTLSRIQELMSTSGNEVKIRFGDHNANSNRHTDLLVYQNKFPTSVTYDTVNKKVSFDDKRDVREGLENSHKNYDGFAVSNNYLRDGHSYILYPSKVFLANESVNSQLSFISFAEAMDLAGVDKAVCDSNY